MRNTFAGYYAEMFHRTLDRDFAAFSGLRCEGVLGSSRSLGSMARGFLVYKRGASIVIYDTIVASCEPLALAQIRFLHSF